MVASSTVAAFNLWGGLVLVGSLLVVACVQLRVKFLCNSAEGAFVGLTVFLLLASGFGIQYLIYICPFLVLVSPSSAVVYSIMAGIFAALAYYHYLVSYWPLASQHSSVFPKDVALLGAYVWLTLLTFLWRFTKGRLKAPKGNNSLV